MLLARCLVKTCLRVSKARVHPITPASTTTWSGPLVASRLVSARNCTEAPRRFSNTSWRFRLQPHAAHFPYLESRQRNSPESQSTHWPTQQPCQIRRQLRCYHEITITIHKMLRRTEIASPSVSTCRAPPFTSKTKRAYASLERSSRPKTPFASREEPRGGCQQSNRKTRGKPVVSLVLCGSGGLLAVACRRLVGSLGHLLVDLRVTFSENHIGVPVKMDLVTIRRRTVR